MHSDNSNLDNSKSFFYPSDFETADSTVFILKDYTMYTSIWYLKHTQMRLHGFVLFVQKYFLIQLKSDFLQQKKLFKIPNDSF